jgi:hypothetical protein
MSQKPGSKAVNNRGGKRGKGRPFKKNDPLTGEKDERINRTGQPRKFDELRERVLNILSEELVISRPGEPERKISPVDAIIRDWIASRDYQKQAKAIEYGFGKVPDELNLNTNVETFIRKNLDLFTDGQLQRLNAGEDGLQILGEVLRDTMNKKIK